MGSFIAILSAVALLNGVVGMISPEGDIKKYVRLVGALCILLAIISPIYAGAVNGDFNLDELFSDIEELEGQYGEMYESALSEGSREQAESAITDAITKKFELAEGDIAVKAEVETENGQSVIGEITVYLNGSAIFADPRQISEYVNELAGCECNIIYD